MFHTKATSGKADFCRTKETTWLARYSMHHWRRSKFWWYETTGSLEAIQQFGTRQAQLHEALLFLFFSALGYSPPHRQTVQRRLGHLHAEHNGLLKKSLSTVRWISVTCDFWSDKRLFSYICLTGHYLKSNFDCVSTIIGFSSFPLRYYATNSSKAIQESLKELNVYEKTITITSDGASNMVKMFETLRPETKRIHCMCNQ